MNSLLEEIVVVVLVMMRMIYVVRQKGVVYVALFFVDSFEMMMATMN